MNYKQYFRRFVKFPSELFHAIAKERLDDAVRACEVHKARATIRAIMVNRIHESARDH